MPVNLPLASNPPAVFVATSARAVLPPVHSLDVTRSTHSGGIAKPVPTESLVVGDSVGKEADPIKAGFSHPAHTRVKQVAPGVLLAPSEEDVATTAPIAISIPNTTTRFHPGHNHHILSTSSNGSVVSNGPISPSSVSARSPINVGLGLIQLKVLANFR